MNDTKKNAPGTAVERIKKNSNYLRGTLVESLADSTTGGLAEDDMQLSKLHGFYQQDDRDIRTERTRQKLEPAYSFMIRARVPGGICTPSQWLKMDELAQIYANNSLRLTTRQAFQLHGVLKGDLKAAIQGINESLLDTIAACGDVNRNVMCTPLAEASAVHGEALLWAQRISAHLTPQTSAYHEIWLDGKKLSDKDDREPIYGPVYLPRKFKIGVAIPPWNDIDVFTQDLGFIAIKRDGKLAGFNVTVGGGLGTSHGEPATYPRLGDTIGYCTRDQVIAVAEHVVGIQRDFGDRSNRKHARLKYTIDAHGLDWFIAELKKRTGFTLPPGIPFSFEHSGDRFGWIDGEDGLGYLTLYIPSGRLRDDGKQTLLSGMREIARIHDGEFRLTPNQNVIISQVTQANRPRIDELTRAHGLNLWRQTPPIRHRALACVAFPTCGLAMAEAERYLPNLLSHIEALLNKHDIGQEEISVRITGCPNGCARPYVAEIGLIGKAPGHYNLMLGGNLSGNRLNRLHQENVAEKEIIATLDDWLGRYASVRQKGETFGDFYLRQQEYGAS
jgi:sulfite reductase (NADPH) hemoprotein beta-component